MPAFARTCALLSLVGTKHTKLKTLPQVVAEGQAEHGALKTGTQVVETPKGFHPCWFLQGQTPPCFCGLALLILPPTRFSSLE